VEPRHIRTKENSLPTRPSGEPPDPLTVTKTWNEGRLAQATII